MILVYRISSNCGLPLNCGLPSNCGPPFGFYEQLWPPSRIVAPGHNSNFCQQCKIHRQKHFQPVVYNLLLFPFHLPHVNNKIDDFIDLSRRWFLSMSSNSSQNLKIRNYFKLYVSSTQVLSSCKSNIPSFAGVQTANYCGLRHVNNCGLPLVLWPPLELWPPFRILWTIVAPGPQFEEIRYIVYKLFP